MQNRHQDEHTATNSQQQTRHLNMKQPYETLCVECFPLSRKRATPYSTFMYFGR